MTPLRIAVLGAGNWGTTLGQLCAENGHRTTLWTRDPAQRDEIAQQHTNTRAVPGLALSPTLQATTDLGAVIAPADLVFMLIPSQAFREVARKAGDALAPHHVVVHGTKGLEAESHARMSEILVAETAVRQLGVVAGPNIAPEIAAKKPAATVAVSAYPRVVKLVKHALSSPRFMVFASSDVLGTELCGALKNVVAIAAGMADEMGVGENAKAFLVTRGMNELTRLAFAMGAEAATMPGLAGIGDLMVTCASPHSRNHRIGVALAKGERLDEAIARLGMVAEGVYASRSARALARQHRVEMPLFERIDRVLHEGLAPRAALEELMHLPSGRDAPKLSRADDLLPRLT